MVSLDGLPPSRVIAENKVGDRSQRNANRHSRLRVASSLGVLSYEVACALPRCATESPTAVNCYLPVLGIVSVTKKPEASEGRMKLHSTTMTTCQSRTAVLFRVRTANLKAYGRHLSTCRLGIGSIYGISRERPPYAE